jgi:hypothetical protein
MQNTNVNERIQLQKARTMNTFKNQNDNKNTNLRIQSQSKGFSEERRRRTWFVFSRNRKQEHTMKNDEWRTNTVEIQWERKQNLNEEWRTNITRFGSDLGFQSRKWRDDGRILEIERTKLRKVFRVLRKREWEDEEGFLVYAYIVVLLIC